MLGYRKSSRIIGSTEPGGIQIARFNNLGEKWKMARPFWRLNSFIFGMDPIVSGRVEGKEWVLEAFFRLKWCSQKAFLLAKHLLKPNIFEMPQGGPLLVINGR